MWFWGKALINGLKGSYFSTLLVLLNVMFLHVSSLPKWITISDSTALLSFLVDEGLLKVTVQKMKLIRVLGTAGYSSCTFPPTSSCDRKAIITVEHHYLVSMMSLCLSVKLYDFSGNLQVIVCVRMFFQSYENNCRNCLNNKTARRVL